jgi:hypothetical protein
MENTATPCAAARSTRVIDLTSEGIPADDLKIALANAALDTDGQIYPWRSGYPLAGGTVAYDGRLWTVSGKQPHSGDDPGAIVLLDGQGHDGRARAVAYELRPVTWTALDEIALEISRAGRSS